MIPLMEERYFLTDTSELAKKLEAETDAGR